ncbi:major facilitator superfamily domain-containing protein [Armillaria luteobubalina]|uniref:Major facilitator superfamily domain-containing protein n=1 Tax=Armillaria luteobubalina TaxID=153913 RepID=A0AA39PUW9_9AGAR|nr:major facilitator superfamily domain-containing protein [Armillaria luteobubalina]
MIRDTITVSTMDTPTLNPPQDVNLDAKLEADRPQVEDTPKDYRVHVQFAALCWSMFLAGWNDGTTGPLLPRIQEVYNVNYTIVSLLFILACVGFLSGAFINIPLTEKLGFGKMIVLGSMFQVVAYALQSAALPFPAFLIAYTINGIGMAFQDAQANGYVACFQDNPETKMGIMHAVYGVGALCSPLVATQFAYLPHWSFHYLASFGVALTNTIFLLAVFRLKTQDDCLAEIGYPPREKGDNEQSAFRQILTLKTVHLLAFFILVYVGVEVTIGGWSVTYVIKLRNGGKNSGYISSGFFGGLTLGRVGERRVLFIYSFIAIGLELVVWLVPSLIGGGVAVSLVGVVLGPMYPIVMNHSSRILPPWLLTGSIGWIAGFGQAGSALFPFITGALANSVGISSLQPLLVAMMGFMIVLWALVPSRRPPKMTPQSTTDAANEAT